MSPHPGSFLYNKESYVIHILNKKDGLRDTYMATMPVIYVGRPTILGNPFYHEKAIDSWWVNGYLIRTKRVGSREEAVAEYGKWLKMHMEIWHLLPDSREAQVWADVLYLAQMYKQRQQDGLDIALECWCAPEACHADKLKAVIEWVNKKEVK